ncbi:hypothetical protein BD324DRAFT_607957 [Kockovaella imperatae]|uniref:Uncharacterized protein n=1 Tax=Kockovaella imperatae TaxID=4999 RepID=A0A1Y1ULY7_9TREE|nr:hypothetical protein BD324DRAFT_607957 [Kockovaella imperatae]ORX38496.1 hypothetical protein BD324DRAFT_607957 [Kockovaella imperatae]
MPSCSTKACKLCRGSMLMTTRPRQPLSGLTSLPATSTECHAHCASFACPGCVTKHRETYSILNMKNHIYDYQCGDCMAEIQLPTSRRGSMESDAGSESSI